MKPWFKRSILTLLALVIVASAWHTIVSRRQRQADLKALQVAEQTPAALELPALDLVPLARHRLVLQVPISGTISAVNSALIKAKLSGELQGLKVREGMRVRAGQVLGQIDPAELAARKSQAQQQALAAKAQLLLAKRLHDNNVALVQQGFISSTALASSQASLDAAQANYAAARAALEAAAKNLDNTWLRAPIDGLVAQRLAQPGEQLMAGQGIVKIVDLSQLELKAELGSAEAVQVKIGQSAQLQVPGLAQSVAGRVVRINPSAATASRMVPVYLALQPNAQLRDGLFAQGSLDIGQIEADAVPLNAVHTDQPRPYIQVVEANRVRRVNVELGARGTVDGQPLVAVQGAKPGMQVILGRVGILREGTPVTVLPAPVAAPVAPGSAPAGAI